MSDKVYDCVIVGGGIGGLTAGIYLARFNCKVCIIDNHDSRASLISCSHNFPAFATGISGNNILTRLRRQYKNYSQKIINATVKKILKNKKSPYFLIKSTHSIIKTKFVILATGVIDVEPPIPNLHSAIKDGLIRHCLICDAYEASRKKILVIGNNKSCLKQAFLLRSYTNNLTVLNIGNKLSFNRIEKQKIKKNNIKIIQEHHCEVLIKNNKITSFTTPQGKLEFDIIYSALGVLVRSELAIKLGAKHTRDKILLVNSHQETSVKSFYAIGDIVKGVNQMCVAASQGAIAAIDIFNKLNKW